MKDIGGKYVLELIYRLISHDFIVPDIMTLLACLPTIFTKPANNLVAQVSAKWWPRNAQAMSLRAGLQKAA